jgi:hypothetical protein
MANRPTLWNRLRVAGLLTMVSLGVFAEPLEKSVFGFGKPNSDAIIVPLVGVLARPTDYDGRLIRVVGVIRVEFEGNSLYLTKEHYLNRIHDNAIWVSLDRSQMSQMNGLSGRYASVEGIFNSKVKGHFGGYQGSLEKINLVTRGNSWGQSKVKRLTLRSSGAARINPRAAPCSTLDANLRVTL